ncbi:YybH family protein [Bacillus horti]|uniref:Uncharacterized protein (TIGR02246 family) n=1 Tax=Caldalkalibacillus horti TaxID=77523 RepID=A0ABT9VXP4_9BACI|nr:DUF4440 domain-containing protein [Bacillus horti]MDQ0165747.1 uncharacterized protein (TIGR02246 family) [Bacillus horti]
MSLSNSNDKVYKPEEMNPAFAKAFNSGKLENLLALFEHDAILFDHGGKPHQGRGPVRETLAKLLQIKGTMVSKNIHCTPFEDIALLRCHFVIHTIDPEGNPTQIEGHSSEVARRQSDGSWLYIIDHPFGSQPLVD